MPVKPSTKSGAERDAVTKGWKDNMSSASRGDAKKAMNKRFRRDSKDAIRQGNYEASVSEGSEGRTVHRGEGFSVSESGQPKGEYWKDHGGSKGRPAGKTPWGADAGGRGGKKDPVSSDGSDLAKKAAKARELHNQKKKKLKSKTKGKFDLSPKQDAEMKAHVAKVKAKQDADKKRQKKASHPGQKVSKKDYADKVSAARMSAKLGDPEALKGKSADEMRRIIKRAMTKEEAAKLTWEARSKLLIGEASDPPVIKSLRKIVSEHQAAKVNGKMVDAYSASAIVAVYDKLNPQNRSQFVSLPIMKMVDMAFRLIKKVGG
jgi:hypothetical protein